MKRLFANPERPSRARATALVVLCTSLILTACSREDRPAPRPADVERSNWMVPPRLDAADFSGDGVVVSGHAEPNRRVVLSDQTGLSAGASARPVGPAGLLATADYDGGGLLVAGRASPGQQVQVALNEGLVRTALADESGWYEARFPAVGPGAHRLRAQSATTLHEVPLVLTAPSGALDFAREPAGLRIDWSPPGGGAQSTWIVQVPSAADDPTAS